MSNRKDNYFNGHYDHERERDARAKERKKAMKEVGKTYHIDDFLSLLHDVSITPLERTQTEYITTIEPIRFRDEYFVLSATNCRPVILPSDFMSEVRLVNENID